MGYISETNVMEFESVDKDNRGNFSFAQSLQRLRRTLLGLGNKVLPVYVMNEKHNLSVISNQYGPGTSVLYTVPQGKKARIISIETTNESISAGGITTVSAIVNGIPQILAYCSDGSGLYRKWDYNDAIELIAGAELGYTNGPGIAGAFICITYIEEDVFQ